jgi:hypothetical protein
MVGFQQAVREMSNSFSSTSNDNKTERNHTVTGCRVHGAKVRSLRRIIGRHYDAV